MNWKKTVVSLSLSVICTLLLIFVISRNMQLPKDMSFLVLVPFFLFAVIFLSIYEIIEKKNVKLNVCFVLEGINGLILILSMGSIVARDRGLLERAMPLPIAMTSLILFFIISGVCMKIEQNMKEKQEEESI